MDVEQEHWKAYNVQIWLEHFAVLIDDKHVFAHTTGGLEIKFCNIMQVDLSIFAAPTSEFACVWFRGLMGIARC